jgi:hypothetical protein
MTILDEAPGLLEALRGEMTPKFLASRNPAGVPNVVPVVTICPAEDQPDTLIFGNFLLRKTIDNLKRDTRVGVLVITQDLRGWVLRGDFLEFQRTGPYVDRQMSGPLLRYNAYTGIRNAGVIRVRELRGSFAIPRLQVARDFLLAKLATLGGSGRGETGTVIPAPVRREYARMVAVKVLAWVGEDGYPTVVPALSLQPAGEGRLLCRKGDGRLGGPPVGATVASNILTFEAISYQAKGIWSEKGATGSIQVQEVYAGGPPLPGGRIV